jgi:cytochrome c556
LSKEEFFVDTRIVSESDEKTENGHVSTAEDKPKVVDDVNTEEAQNEVRSEVIERLYTTLHTTNYQIRKRISRTGEACKYE